METLYRKVEIKSEKDLPKEDKRFYFHLRSDSGLRNCRPDSSTFRQIKKRIDWYLQPIESPKLTDEMIETEYPTDINIIKKIEKIEAMSYEAEKVLAYIRNFNLLKQEGAKWYRDQLKQQETGR